MTVQFDYRCRRCGMVFSEGQARQTLAMCMTIAVLCGSHQGEGLPMAPSPVTVHKCDSDVFGVSDFIGYSPVTE